MKRLSLLVACLMALTLTSGMSWRALGQEQVPHSDPVTGQPVGPGDPDSLTLGGETTNRGAFNGLPGTYTITIRYNRATSQIIGGQFTRTIKQRNADGGYSELGTVSGNVTAGTVTLGEDGEVTQINAAQLVVTAGNGSYAGTTEGTGTFEGSISAIVCCNTLPKPRTEDNGQTPPPPPPAQPDSTENPPPNVPGSPVPPFSGTMSLTF